MHLNTISDLPLRLAAADADLRFFICPSGEAS